MVAAPIVPNNAGFETGNLTGWQSIGQVSATGPVNILSGYGQWGVNPAGNYMAMLSTGWGVGHLELDAFFGLAPGTIYGAIPDATNGAGILQSVTGNAGDTVTLYWAFVTTDFADYNDTGFAVGSVVPLACIVDGCQFPVGDFGATGWHPFTFTLPSTGTHTIGFGVVNTGDEAMDSILFVDDDRGHLAIPEPSTAVLAGGALLALGLLRLRRPASTR
jgi:hypothetical protein